MELAPNDHRHFRVFFRSCVRIVTLAATGLKYVAKDMETPRNGLRRLWQWLNSQPRFQASVSPNPKPNPEPPKLLVKPCQHQYPKPCIEPQVQKRGSQRWESLGPENALNRPSSLNQPKPTVAGFLTNWSLPCGANDPCKYGPCTLNTVNPYMV